MHEETVEHARKRLAAATSGRPAPADVDAVLERARSQLETFAQSAAELQGTLPTQVADAIRDGLRAEALPLARHVSEVRGLTNQTIRRLERLDTDIQAERYARVDDLALLVDLLVSGWRSLSERLDRIERMLEASAGATVHHLERRAGA
jgi:hypothetical protein